MHLRYQLNANYRLQDLKPAVEQDRERTSTRTATRFEIKSVYTLLRANRARRRPRSCSTDADKAKRSVADIKEEIRKDMPELAVGKIGFDFGGNGSGSAAASISR